MGFKAEQDKVINPELCSPVAGVEASDRLVAANGGVSLCYLLVAGTKHLALKQRNRGNTQLQTPQAMAGWRALGPRGGEAHGGSRAQSRRAVHITACRKQRDTSLQGTPQGFTVISPCPILSSPTF